MALGLALVAALAILVAPTTAGAAPGGNNVASAACKGGGWRDLVDVNGSQFKNQGQCVAAAVQGRLGQDLNRQVTGTFTGTTSFTFGVPACQLAFQVFDATFATPTGPGSFHIEGCVAIVSHLGGALFQYTGSFTLTAPDGGTLAGAVNGVIDGSAGASTFDTTLTVNTGTGTLDGATGTLGLVGQWDTSVEPNIITGTLTGQLS